MTHDPIVSLSPTHAEALASLHALAFPPEDRWTATAFAVQLQLPGVFGLMYYPEGLILARVAADEAEILTFGVVPASRRLGIGARLLRAAQCHATRVGALTMFLDVSAGNMAARALYSSCGYQEVGRRARYYADGSDALVLALTLSPCAARGA